MELVQQTNGSLASKDELLIAIPALNEEEGVGIVIDELRQAGYDNIVVVDGYSTDNTAEAARKKGVVVIQQHGRGKSGAIRTAIDCADTPFILFMDADHTYDAKDIEKMLVHADKYDEIIGIRENHKEIPKLNRVGNWILNSAFNILMSTSLSDVCSGMYLLKTETARDLALATRGFDVEVEVAAQMAMIGAITEVPIDYRERLGVRKLQPWKAGFNIFATITNLFRTYNPVLFYSLLGSVLLIPGVIICGWEFALRYLYGSKYWSIGWTFLGLVLLVVGLQSFTLATISTLLRRLEKRITKTIRHY